METEKMETHAVEEEIDATTTTSSWFVVEDETSEELSKLLDMFVEAPPPPLIRVRFIEDPYSAPVVFQPSSSFVTIDGNEESCGSSFSDLDSSAMASVDRGGLLGASGFFSNDDDDGGVVEYDLEGLLNDFDGCEGVFESS